MDVNRVRVLQYDRSIRVRGSDEARGARIVGRDAIAAEGKLQGLQHRGTRAVSREGNRSDIADRRLRAARGRTESRSTRADRRAQDRHDAARTRTLNRRRNVGACAQRRDTGRSEGERRGRVIRRTLRAVRCNITLQGEEYRVRLGNDKRARTKVERVSESTSRRRSRVGRSEERRTVVESQAAHAAHLERRLGARSVLLDREVRDLYVLNVGGFSEAKIRE